jgi:hypothetical protein
MGMKHYRSAVVALSALLAAGFAGWLFFFNLSESDAQIPINDTVNTKSRKTFPGTLIGFVNIKASRAKCSVLTASRG